MINWKRIINLNLLKTRNQMEEVIHLVLEVSSVLLKVQENLLIVGIRIKGRIVKMSGLDRVSRRIQEILGQEMGLRLFMLIILNPIRQKRNWRRFSRSSGK